MKTKMKKDMIKTYRQKLLTTSITALCTGLVSTSVTHASDVAIYQEAKSGQITLMFMLDISGSMGAPQLTNDKSACDAPSSSSSGSETSINGSPSYTRYYCNVNETTRLYYSKRIGNKSSNYQYFSCGTDGSISQGDCIITLASAPSTSGMNNTQTGSGSSTITYYYKDVTNTIKYYDRITRVKDGMFDLLYGNTAKGIVKLDDAKVIGLSTFSRPTSFDSSGQPLTADNVRGQVRIPARPLGEKVNGVTQRQILLNEIAKLGARGGTPTANAYAETAAYLFGSRTTSSTTKSIPKFFKYYSVVSTTPTYYYRRTGSFSYTYYRCQNSGAGVTNTSNCTSSTTVSSGAVSGLNYTGTNPRYYYEDIPTYSTIPSYQSCTAFNLNGCMTWSGASTTNPTTSSYTGSCSVGSNTGMCANEDEEFLNAAADSGFEYSYKETKNDRETLYKQPDSLQQTDDIKKCSGQGVYVLTDGAPNNNSNAKSLMQTALTASKSSTLSCSDSDSGWNCMHNFVQNLLDPTKNPAGLKIKTAVVGFGSAFNDVTSFDRTKTQQQNIEALGTIDTDVKNAAYWGIIGEGGWYSGNSSQDIVNSVNAFLGDLNTDIPAVTTGSPTVPRDSLNPAVLQKEAYFPQFQPTPDKSYQLWAGNLKKYDILNGLLKDKGGNKITDDKGRLIDNYDLWSTAVDSNPAIRDADENTYGSKKFALKGGAWSQLKLKMNTAVTPNQENRKLFTNRIASGTGSSATFVNSTTLRQVKITDLSDTTYQNDPNRGYLTALLGYAVDAINPASITTNALTAAPELRQIGAVMHSSPVLVTNKGKLTYTDGVVGSENRNDYVLFGTTQGLLHVVDAKTGTEKFAFVPNEMIESQKEAFLKYDTTNGGMNNLYYGIDAPWTTYTEYVIDSSKNLTVNNGVRSQKGKQIAYGGLRMGGRSYYALNLQDIDKPELLFQISPDDQKVYANNSSKSFSQLQYMGQSWSKPTITWVKWGKTRKRVMFVGGGYDAGYESSDYNQTTKKGGGVYMFDADNGDLLWWASANAATGVSNNGVVGLKDSNLQYSVVSEIRTEDRNDDGLADHLYFGDLGGQLFRIDIDNTAETTANFAKTPRRLLNLNAGAKSPRFYEMPAFSIYDYAGNTFAVVSIGSGNRSVPLQEYTFGMAGYNYDAVYNIYDRDVTARDLYKSDYTFSTSTLTRSNLGEITQANRNNDTTLVAPYPQTSTDKQGWYYDFKSNKLQSAKVLATPIVLSRRLYVTTFDASKPGLAGDCGAGVKGESFVSQFCLPFGQCTKEDIATKLECTEEGGCSIGAGIQDVIPVDPCADPTKEECNKAGGGGKVPKPEDKTNNKNYCVSTGNRAIATPTGPIGNTSTRRCLEPTRWYERSQ